MATVSIGGKATPVNLSLLDRMSFPRKPENHMSAFMQACTLLMRKSKWLRPFWFSPSSRSSLFRRAARRAAQRPTPSDQCHRGPFDPSPNYYLKMFFESRHTGVQSDLINAESPPTPLHCGEITPISAPAWLMATLINAEGVCPSGGPCGGGGSAEPAVAARASNHIHAHVQLAARSPASSRVHICLLQWGLFLCGCLLPRLQTQIWRCELRQVWQMTPRCGCAFRSRSPPFFHTWGPVVSTAPSFCIKSSRAARVWPQPLLVGEGITTHRTFWFPPPSPSTLSCNTQKSQRTPASAAKSSAPTCSRKIRQTHWLFSRRPLSTESVHKDGTEEALYRSNTASNAFITNCRECGAPLTLG